MGRSQPLQLVVDPVAHAEELARFEAHVVRGPGAEDCAIWTGAVGTDGYGRFWVGRGSDRIMVRPNRYALAAALEGEPLAPWVRALHGCLCIGGLTMRVSRRLPMRRRARISGCLSRDGGCGSRRIV